MARLDLRQVFPSQVQVAADDLEPSGNDGLGTLRVVHATYDFAVDAGAISTITLKDEKSRADIVIPDNAIVLGSMVDVITTFTTASADAGTIALQINVANDIVTATAVSGGSDIWDAGLQAGVPVWTAATAIKLTAARTPSIVIGGQVVTAGKVVVVLAYIESD